MVSFESDGKRLRGAREPRPPAGPSDPTAERVNEEFAKLYGRPPKRRTELIRYTMHARFMGRWSAP